MGAQRIKVVYDVIYGCRTVPLMDMPPEHFRRKMRWGWEKGWAEWDAYRYMPDMRTMGSATEAREALREAASALGVRRRPSPGEYLYCTWHPPDPPELSLFALLGALKKGKNPFDKPAPRPDLEGSGQFGIGYVVGPRFHWLEEPPTDRWPKFVPSRRGKSAA